MSLRNFILLRRESTTYHRITSTDDPSYWYGPTALISDTSSDIYAAYGRNKFVVVDATGHSYYSSEVGYWTRGNNLPTASVYTNLCYANFKFFATGYNKVVYSTDGITWTSATMPSTKYWSSVTYGNGLFVAVGRDDSGGTTATNTYAYSIDGITWSSGTLPSSQLWRHVIFGNGRFVAHCPGSTTSIAYSLDGINWTPVTYTSTSANFGYGGGKFVIINNTNIVASSTDGVTWNNGGLIYGGHTVSTWSGLSYSDVSGQWIVGGVAIGELNNLVYYSSDLTTWTTASLGTSDFGLAPFITAGINTDIAYVYKKALSTATATAIRSKAFIVLAYSTTVSTATAVANYITRPWKKAWSMIWDSTKWIGIKADSTTAVTSTDSTTWTTHTLPASVSWTGLATNGTTHVAIAADTSTFATSTDGITWTSRTATNRSWSGIAASASTFVVIAMDSDYCTTSTDGITWTEHAMPQSDKWSSIAYDGSSTFVAVTHTGNAASSTDNGATWTMRTMPDAVKYNCVTWALGQFTTVASAYPEGMTDKAATSPDGITWTSITMPVMGSWQSVGPGVGHPNV